MTDHPTALVRALLVVLAGLLARYAIRLPTTGGLESVFASTLLAAALLAALAALSPRPGQYGAWVAAGALTACAAAGLWVALTRGGPTTDAYTFTRYAGDLLLAGENPYPASMRPAFTEYARDPLRPTPRVDGSYVTTYSYPGGGILFGAAIAAAATAIQGGGYAFLVALLALAGGLLYHELPQPLAALAPISLLASHNLWLATTGGIIDAIWLLPLLATMACWRRDNLRLAGVCFGIAVAAKQQPWLIAPALLVLLWRTTPATTRVRRCLAFAGPAAGTFTAINLPFILAAPVAWLKGVFVALSLTKPDIIQEGVGLVRLSTTGVLPLSNLAFGALTAAALLAALAAVWRWPRQTSWLVWLIPPAVLFWSPRSLTSYFTFFVPVAAAALAEYVRDHDVEDASSDDQASDHAADTAEVAHA